MAIYLTTGKPGSFKSASLMESALKEIESGRLVYFCNFRNLKAEEYSLNIMDHFQDWVDVPDGALIIVDEVQEFTRDVPTNCKTEDLPKWMTLLEKHRHRGIDIHVVTQHPMFIHTHIRRLLEKHTHMQRVQGLPWSNKREWQQVCNEPENPLNCTIKSGCTTTVYKPNKKVFNYYESTVVDTHKFKIPTKLIKSMAIIGSLVTFAVWIGYPVAQKYLNLNDQPKTQSATQNPNAPLSPTLNNDASTLAGQYEIQAKINNCVEMMGLTFDQCKDLYDVEAREKRNAELQSKLKNDMDSIVVQYSANNPYQSFDVSYEVTAKPVFSGCVKFDGRYFGYSQQGTKLEVSKSDCQKLIDQGDRPFNYFSQQQQTVQNQQVINTEPNPIPANYDAEFIAKYHEAKRQGLI